MKVALLGATGFVGSALLKEALQRGHTVTAIVRHPEKLEQRQGLVARAGDVYDTSSLAKLIEGHDALISAFNPGWNDPNLYADQVRGTASIIKAVKLAGIKRVLWVGGAGGLQAKPGVRVIDDPNMPAWVKPGSLATIDALEQLRKEPDLGWSFLAPSATLKPITRTGKFRLGSDHLLVDEAGQSVISVEDYAVAMIDELETQRISGSRSRWVTELVISLQSGAPDGCFFCCSTNARISNRRTDRSGKKLLTASCSSRKVSKTLSSLINRNSSR
jgi:putative NADH-flavin reductase